MYPDNAINILVGIGLAVTLAVSFSAARKGIKQSVTKFVFRPKTWLQNIPPNVAAFVLILEILGVFRIGTLDTSGSGELFYIRVAGLAVFILASVFQFKAHKNLGDSYSQEIAIVKEHKLVTNKLHRFIRHPQYVGQIMSDIGAGVALAGFIILPLVIFVEAPLLLLRARREDKLLENHFEDEWREYKKKSGFIIPFIG
jgi:protein-S-isoprenylcysteine O-methyltransferase Ste14